MRLVPFCPSLGYAETHYSFRLIPSRLRKPEPEVVADVPHRLAPGRDLPVLVLVKDAHLFPGELSAVEVSVQTADGRVHTADAAWQPAELRAPLWYTLLVVPRPPASGPCRVAVKLTLTVAGTRRVYLSDNYRVSSHAPLECYLAEEPLPATDGWHFGDLHCHSAYTSDQVEFGAPLRATLAMALAEGLSFFAVTDHSYDLDDSLGSPLRNDHALPKWHQMRAEVAALNASNSGCVVIPGEELSCGNSRRRNVHMLVLDNGEFLEGSGDSAERWLRTRPQLSIANALDRLDEQALAYAAHPEDRTPFLQWLLIRRGKWTTPDYLHPRLNGLQLYNGHLDQAMPAALRRWVRLLGTGKRLSLIAGNDGHGNFATFRQIGFPFLTLREQRHQLFGVARTGVLLQGPLSLQSVKEGLRAGRTVVTTGPFMDLVAQTAAGCARIGQTAPHPPHRLLLHLRSSAEFGRLERATVWLGKRGAQREQPLWECAQFAERFSHEEEIEVSPADDVLYLRGELHAQGPQGRRSCYTTPIWLAQK